MFGLNSGLLFQRIIQIVLETTQATEQTRLEIRETTLISQDRTAITQDQITSL